MTFFQMPIPPEMQAEYERQQQLHQMSVSSARHEFIRFIDEMEDDGLQQLRGVFIALSDADTGPSGAAWYAGYVVALMHGRGICAACNERHDVIPVDLAPEAGEPEPEQPGE